MTPAISVASKLSIVQGLHALEPRLGELGRAELHEALAPMVERLHDTLPAEEVAPAVQEALALCRRLYAGARSGDGLNLARAALAQATIAADVKLQRLAGIACGLLAADAADIVTAIEHHVRVLRLAAASDNRVEMGSAWNNLGTAMGIAGNYEMAARCYLRCLGLLEAETDPIYGRFAACGNLADSMYQVGSFGDGLVYAERALLEQTPAFSEADPHSALLLRRTLVRLLVASDRVAEARPHVLEAVSIAERTRTPRAVIAAATTRAVYELAVGQTDLALTRLDQALSKARQVPAALRDTLAVVIRAEEAAGNAERALLRLGELSDHIYRFAVERARAHVELANLPVRIGTRLDADEAQARARLVSKLAPLSQPECWPALDRLAVSATMRFDKTGWHGKRVGALTKALAMASGLDPLQALEMGLAAELHDVGMMSVPEGILAKKGPLNEAEQALVRRHVDAAAEILSDDRHSRILLARDIARYHHAHWDGSGYPERVGGKLIPLGARVCAIADAYDSMVFGIDTRAPRTMDEALGELNRLAGQQFDPELVVCFDNLIRTETEDLGMDLSTNAGMESFQELVKALGEDRGFV